jgi:hypothetical protein
LPETEFHCLLPSCFTMNHEHDVELRPRPLRRLSPKPISAISSCLPLRHLCPIRVPGWVRHLSLYPPMFFISEIKVSRPHSCKTVSVP